MRAQPSGVITSLITPFKSSLPIGGQPTIEIDVPRVESLVRRQARSGVAAVAVAGWIGEGSTLSDDERRILIEAAVASRDSLMVLAHVGTPSTARSVALAQDAEAAGAGGLILVLPFYNRPNHRGVLRHVATVAASTGLPIHLELDEAATNVHLTIAQISELTRIDGVAGIIDHSPNPLHVERKSSARRGVSFLAAHERTATACGLLRADGIFSAVANVFPEGVVALWSAIASGDAEAARLRDDRLLPTVQFVEQHGVAGLKHLLADTIDGDRTVRLPLVALEDRPDAYRVAS